MALLEKHLVVKRSTLPKAGKGLYTKVSIHRGKIIVEYKGKVTTWKDVNDDLASFLLNSHIGFLIK